jgi:hypothetical protein
MPYRLPSRYWLKSNENRKSYTPVPLADPFVLDRDATGDDEAFVFDAMFPFVV